MMNVQANNNSGASGGNRKYSNEYSYEADMGRCWKNQISTDIVAVVDTVLQLNTICSMQLLY